MEKVDSHIKSDQKRQNIAELFTSHSFMTLMENYSLVFSETEGVNGFGVMLEKCVPGLSHFQADSGPALSLDVEEVEKKKWAKLSPGLLSLCMPLGPHRAGHFHPDWAVVEKPNL